MMKITIWDEFKTKPPSKKELKKMYRFFRITESEHKGHLGHRLGSYENSPDQKKQPGQKEA